MQLENLSLWVTLSRDGISFGSPIFFERASKGPDLPQLHKIKAAIIACRTIRNEFAHRTYNSQEQGLNDAKFASVLDCTRDCLPKVNKLTGGKFDEIYDKIAVLENILYQQNSKDDDGSDVRNLL